MAADTANEAGITWKQNVLLGIRSVLRIRKGLRTDTFLGVNFSDRVRNPIGLVRELYRQLGHKLSSDVVGATRGQSIRES